jgi:hypothetical protein
MNSIAPKPGQEMAPELHHVLYEINMLCHTAWALGNPHETNRNALLESFVIHARNLNEFFGSKSEAKNAMLAGHFVPWVSQYTREGGRLIGRASEQVAHITFKRERPDEKTGWDCVAVFKMLYGPCLAFLNAVSANEELMKFANNQQHTREALQFYNKIMITDTGLLLRS